MVHYDFPEKTRDLVEQLEEKMAKVVVLHKIQSDTTFVYFLGYVKVRAGFEKQAQRQTNWVPKKELMEMVRDGKARRGSVPLSTRVIAAALRTPLFESEIFRITFPREMECRKKPSVAAATVKEEPLPAQIFVTPTKPARGKNLAEEEGMSQLPVDVTPSELTTPTTKHSVKEVPSKDLAAYRRPRRAIS